MALGRDPRVAFLGNVGVGRDVQLQDLRAYYNAVTTLPCRCTRPALRECVTMSARNWTMTLHA